MTRTSASLALAALLLAACGSSSKSGSSAASSSGASTSSSAPASTTASPAAGQTVKTEADGGGGLYFEKKKLSAKAGTVTLAMENPSKSGIPHGIAVQGHGVDRDGKVVQPGGTSTVTVRLKPGTYKFYCPVPGHEKAGMTGVLVVQ